MSTVTDGLRRTLETSPTQGVIARPFVNHSTQEKSIVMEQMQEAYRLHEDAFPKNSVRVLTREMSGSNSP